VIDIGKPGAEAVSKTLVANKTLQSLSLRENGFGNEGAVIIAQVQLTTGDHGFRLYYNFIVYRKTFITYFEVGNQS
jgi:hypothetical protein